MHVLCTHTLHNDETLDPLTWTRSRVCPLTIASKLSSTLKYSQVLSSTLKYSQVLSSTLKYSQVLSCFVMCLIIISKYTTFKPIVCVLLSHITLTTILTLCSIFSWKLFVNNITLFKLQQFSNCNTSVLKTSSNQFSFNLRQSFFNIWRRHNAIVRMNAPHCINKSSTQYTTFWSRILK